MIFSQLYILYVSLYGIPTSSPLCIPYNCPFSVLCGGIWLPAQEFSLQFLSKFSIVINTFGAVSARTVGPLNFVTVLVEYRCCVILSYLFTSLTCILSPHNLYFIILSDWNGLHTLLLSLIGKRKGRCSYKLGIEMPFWSVLLVEVTKEIELHFFLLSF